VCVCVRVRVCVRARVCVCSCLCVCVARAVRIPLSVTVLCSLRLNLLQSGFNLGVFLVRLIMLMCVKAPPQSVSKAYLWWYPLFMCVKARTQSVSKAYVWWYPLFMCVKARTQSARTQSGDAIKWMPYLPLMPSPPGVCVLQRATHSKRLTCKHSVQTKTLPCKHLVQTKILCSKYRKTNKTCTRIVHTHTKF